MKISFIPLDYDYFEFENRIYLKIFGKNDEGKNCCLIDEYENFFYVLCKKPEDLLKKIKSIKEIKKAEIIKKNFLGREVEAIKVYCNLREIENIKEKIKKFDKNIETKERDINIITKYIIEKKLKPLFWYDIEVEFITEKDLFGILNSLNVNFVFKIKKIYNKEKENIKKFFPKVLSFDIETDNFEIGKGEILMISFVSDNIKKVLTWKHESKKDFVEYCRNEKEVIEKFQDYVKKIDPDIITGYFSDGFDFPYLRTRAEKLKINFILSRDNSKVLFSGRTEKHSKIKGRIHVDLLKFIETYYSQYLQSETLSLNEVSSELLGEKKLNFDKKNNINEKKLKKEDWEDYFDYCLQDSLLTYKLFQKLWPDMLEFTRIIHEPLYNISRFGISQAVENYIIHHLYKFNEIAERKPINEEIEKRIKREKYEGAFVLQPKPGLYENIAFFDFTSMYPSIIVSFNLSLSTFLEKKEKDSYEIDLENKKVYFSKKKGFMPKLLEDIIILRKKYKEELKNNPDPILKARSNAFKLLANAFYGYNGFFGARYYCVEAAAAAAAIARKLIKEVIEKTNKEGYSIIYADTDGFAFSLNNKNKKETLIFLEKLNKDLPGIMELELEDFYKRGIWVTKRTHDFGAKKKYALINYEGKLKIRGFETVRRDWCELAREVQNNVLRMILLEGNEKNALKYVQEIIKKLKRREVEKNKLLIKTQLKKPLSEYKSESPHVTIAKKMEKLGIPVNVGMLIMYYIGETIKNEKKVLIRERAKLPQEDYNYDINYYVNHQIIPAVENIFEIFNINVKEIFKEILDGKKQKKLLDY
ncbi:MAG: DNA-directed DNA polymerase [Candidatus Pacearchaeota archaeon]